jgi:ankyrin repeat protein
MACNAGNEAMVRRLLELGADIHARDSNKMTPLHRAATQGSMGICEMLLRHGAEVNAVAILGNTPLFIAIRDNSVDLVKLLLSNGADPNLEDAVEHIPLFYATGLPDSTISKLLFEHGAVVPIDHRPFGKGIADMDISVYRLLMEHWEKTYADSDTDLQLARKIVREKLESIDDDLRRNGQAPFVRRWCGDFSALAYCIVKSQFRLNGDTPLLVETVYARNIELCRALVEIYSEVDGGGARLDETDLEGRTALHVAAKLGSYDVCVILLDHGADVGIPNKQGKTALEVAGSRQVRRILSDAMSRLDALRGLKNGMDTDGDTADTVEADSTIQVSTGKGCDSNNPHMTCSYLSV